MIRDLPPIIYALGDDPFQPGSPGGEMKCPTCGENTPDAWSPLHALDGTVPGGYSQLLEGPQPHSRIVQLDWMRCANPECKELVIRVREGFGIPHMSMTHTDAWLARPRVVTRRLDDAIKDPYRTDYLEAAAILDISPRMSAVLSRRILADLLEKYASQDQFSLTARIDKFAEDTSHPGQLRENLHHFREVADFGAHTQKDDQAQVIDVGREEAEWTLDLLDRLFEYFILTPERDRKMRTAMDERIKDAGRKPLTPADGEDA